MATGGGPRTFVKGSDEFYLFMCSPCSRKEFDVGAEVYCLQCEEHLCGKCHINHDSFAKMATHTMLNRDQMEAKGPQQVQPQLTVQILLSVPCDLHPDERYNLFCGNHDQVCCAVCSRIYHKSCEVRYILDVEKEAMQSQKLDMFRRATKQIQNNLEKVKNQRELDVQRMTAEKDVEINKIHSSIQQMIKHLEATEKAAVNDVTRKFIEYKTKIDDDLAKLNTMINALNTRIDKLEKANNDTEKFVHMKLCEDDKSSARKLIKDVEAAIGEERPVFLIDWRVEESILKLRSLGQLVLDYRYAVTQEGLHHMDAKKDKNVCEINSICLVEKGRLLIADCRNECLKRIDQNYTVIDRLKLNGLSQGMCAISESQVAVCMYDAKTVQLVILDRTMSMSKSFKTTDRCSHIVYHADNLYVTCGGGKADDGPGHIAVYSIGGTLVRKLETDSRGQLFSSFPVGIAVNSMEDVILVCDIRCGLVALRQNGERLWTLTCEDLEMDRVNRVKVDSHGQALVSSWRSSKVVLVSRDGRNLGEVLTARDGVNGAKALCLNRQQSLLIVGMKENNHINVFKLT